MFLYSNFTGFDCTKLLQTFIRMLLLLLQELEQDDDDQHHHSSRADRGSLKSILGLRRSHRRPPQCVPVAPQSLATNNQSDSNLYPVHVGYLHLNLYSSQQRKEHPPSNCLLKYIIKNYFHFIYKYYLS